MNRDTIEGKLKQATGRIKEKWGKLTDDEVNQASGSREALEGRIQEKYGLSKDEARRQVDDFMARN
jgi:uncharacterized protein YjbJ (UPF0337 family)